MKSLDNKIYFCNTYFKDTIIYININKKISNTLYNTFRITKLFPVVPNLENSSACIMILINFGTGNTSKNNHQ
jgi:hypothetical protein